MGAKDYKSVKITQINQIKKAIGLTASEAAVDALNTRVASVCMRVCVCKPIDMCDIILVGLRGRVNK